MFVSHLQPLHTIHHAENNVCNTSYLARFDMFRNPVLSLLRSPDEKYSHLVDKDIWDEAW